MLFTIPFLHILALIIILLIISIIVIGYLFSFKIELKRYDISKNEVKENKNLDDPFKNKIVFFSDLHLGRTMKMKDLNKILELLDSLKANLYIFGGDFVGNNFKRYYDDEKLKSLLNNYFLNHKCIAINGNHDIKENIDLTKYGFKLLNDDEYIYNNIHIYGLKDGYLENLNKPNLDNNNLNIVLIHEGDFFDSIDGNYLMLSGHTHGGQIRLPFIPIYYKPKFGKKYHFGLYKKQNKQLIVSKGLGCNLFKMRLFAKCDIIMLDIK